MKQKPFFIDARPAPTPVRTSTWLPLAKKHGMWIDFENNCVSVTKHAINEFWGDSFDEQDVGAAVIKVAKVIEGASAAVARTLANLHPGL